MSSSLWVDLQEQSGLPVLLEHQSPYERFQHSVASQMILVIRGPKSKYARQQIHIYHEGSGLILECALHLERDLASEENYDATGSLIQYPLNMLESHSFSLQRIAHTFYSLALISNGLLYVFGQKYIHTYLNSCVLYVYSILIRLSSLPK